MSTLDPVQFQIPKVAARTRLIETSEAIRRIILDGTLPSGSRVKDQQLALNLGVSRATVREAVRQLVHEGLLTHEPYKGLTVATIDDETVVQLAEVRAALETLAAERVARAMDGSIRSQLRAALADLESALRAFDVAGVNQAHIAFHRLILTLSGNPILAESWTGLELRARLEMRVDLETRRDLNRLLRDHQATLDVIEAGDSGPIAEHFAGHIMDSARDVIEVRRGAPQAAKDQAGRVRTATSSRPRGHRPRLPGSTD